MEALAKVGLKMFLGVSADVTNWNQVRPSTDLIAHCRSYCAYLCNLVWKGWYRVLVVLVRKPLDRVRRVAGKVSGPFILEYFVWRHSGWYLCVGMSALADLCASFCTLCRVSLIGRSGDD